MITQPQAPFLPTISQHCNLFIWQRSSLLQSQMMHHHNAVYLKTEDGRVGVKNFNQSCEIGAKCSKFGVQNIPLMNWKQCNYVWNNMFTARLEWINNVLVTNYTEAWSSTDSFKHKMFWPSGKKKKRLQLQTVKCFSLLWKLFDEGGLRSTGCLMALEVECKAACSAIVQLPEIKSQLSINQKGGAFNNLPQYITHIVALLTKLTVMGPTLHGSGYQEQGRAASTISLISGVMLI